MRALLMTAKKKGWRQPWANTVAYYPLTSETTVNDMKGMGTAYNLSTAGSPTFVTRWWVSCAYLDWVDDAFTQGSITTNLIWNEFTCLFWSYLESWDTGAEVSTLLYSWWKFYWWYIEHSKSSISSEVLNWSWNNLSKSLTIPTNTRNLIGITHNSSSITTLYYNWALQATKTQALGLKNTHFVIWAGNYTWTLEYYKKWAMSNVILENKARTADEISDYYNQTKSIYWISNVQSIQNNLPTITPTITPSINLNDINTNTSGSGNIQSI